jgi:hypothetical protein
MQAGRRRQAPRPCAAFAPRVFGLLLAALLALSAVPNAVACCGPDRPAKPAAAAGRIPPPAAAGEAGAAAGTVATEAPARFLGASASRAGQPRCSVDPLDAQSPRIEAPDSRPVHSPAAADGLPASAAAPGGAAGRVGRAAIGARGGAGPPLWLRTCVSRT